jgi:hypothetical protein
MAKTESRPQSWSPAVRFQRLLGPSNRGQLPPVCLNMAASSKVSQNPNMAGFEVIIYGRFWVIAEAFIDGTD